MDENMFDPAKYVSNILSELRRECGESKSILAIVSGGVDSVTSAILVKMALGDVVRATYIDTGFMRTGEGEKVRESLKNVLDVAIVDRSRVFYSALLGLEDAEQKRLVFRDTFYRVVSDLVRDYGSDYVVQGTIKADIVETVGGVKTQHNVLSEELQKKYGVRVIEPLRDLYKNEVIEVARYLGIPTNVIRRQPFPGPGLLVRTVGRFTLEKLSIVRRATEIVEESLASTDLSQYFAAVWENELGGSEKVCVEQGTCLEYRIFKILATGVRNGRRIYAPVALLEDYPDISKSELLKLSEKLGVSRFVVLINEKIQGGYFVSVRAVKTSDFITADVVRPSDEVLHRLSSKILSIDGVGAVGFDITPKPPATIEYE